MLIDLNPLNTLVRFFRLYSVIIEAKILLHSWFLNLNWNDRYYFYNFINGIYVIIL